MIDYTKKNSEKNMSENKNKKKDKLVVQQKIQYEKDWFLKLLAPDASGEVLSMKRHLLDRLEHFEKYNNIESTDLKINIEFYGLKKPSTPFEFELLKEK
jgi:hypothetical protein